MTIILLVIIIVYLKINLKIKMVELYTQIKKLELGLVYNYVIENNNAYMNPYHNNFHLEHVCLFSLKGCEYYKVEIPWKRMVATAALFHDFNHSGGKDKNDDDNILLAIKGFIDFNLEYNIFDEEEQKVITNLIKCTRYPYTNDSDSLTLTENILRDSDILQGPFCQNYINGVVYGIAREAGIPLDKMLAGQVEFLKSAKFCTEWATSLYENILPDVLDKVESARQLV